MMLLDRAIGFVILAGAIGFVALVALSIDERLKAGLRGHEITITYRCPATSEDFCRAAAAEVERWARERVVMGPRDKPEDDNGGVARALGTEAGKR
jgi:hypothetical protein